MGAHFRLPIQTLTWEEIQRGDPLVEGLPGRHAGQSLLADRFQPAAGANRGGGGRGRHASGARLAAMSVSIPMPGQAKSLNAGVAEGINVRGGEAEDAEYKTALTRSGVNGMAATNAQGP